MSERTLDPHYIDVNLASSSVMLQKMTSYVDLLLEFPDEVSLNMMYKHTDSHSDPHTSKVKIFEQLNSGDLNLRDSSSGVSNARLDPKQVTNKHYRDQLPDTYHMKTSDSSKTGEPVMKGEMEVLAETRQVVKQWSPVGDPNAMHTTGEWKIIKNNTERTAMIEPLPEANTTAVEISDNFGMKDMGPWFIMHWIDKFNTAHKNIKSDLLLALGDDNEFFVNFSESVGQLKNLETYSDTSTSPIWDYDIEVFGGEAPNIAPGVATYNIPAETVALMDTLSFNTNKLYRNNMKNLMEDASKDTVVPGVMPSFSQTSHGNNLVDDGNHNSRMYGMIEGVIESIEKHLKGLYPVLELMTVKENATESGKSAVVDMKVEGYTVGVDLLKNRIKRFSETRNQTTSLFGKATKYGTQYKSKDYLDNK